MTIYVYTQHESTIRALEGVCGSVVRLRQDRSRDVVEDVLSQLPQNEPVLLYAVMPLDKAIELVSKTPNLRLRLLQLDGRVVEKLTGRPYDPKAEYSDEVLRQALKVYEIRGGSVRYLGAEQFLQEVGGKRVAVFNDVVREAIRLVAEKASVKLELVKTCDGSSCVEVNPLGHRSGYRISFPATSGRLTAEQMAELVEKGEARIYYLEVEAQEAPLSP